MRKMLRIQNTYMYLVLYRLVMLMPVHYSHNFSKLLGDFPMCVLYLFSSSIVKAKCEMTLHMMDLAAVS